MGTLFLAKEARIYNGTKSLFNKWCWENWTATCKRMKLEHFLTPYTKINSKWIKDLNVRPETIKILEENIGRTLADINQSKILYDSPPRLMEIKRKAFKFNQVPLVYFCFYFHYSRTWVIKDLALIYVIKCSAYIFL